MESEVLEIEIELGNGSKEKMSVQEVDSDWSYIESGTRAILVLVNDQQMLVSIDSADDNGVSFNIIGDKRTYYCEEDYINKIFIEVQNIKSGDHGDS